MSVLDQPFLGAGFLGLFYSDVNGVSFFCFLTVKPSKITSVSPTKKHQLEKGNEERFCCSALLSVFSSALGLFKGSFKLSRIQAQFIGDSCIVFIAKSNSC